MKPFHVAIGFLVAAAIAAGVIVWFAGGEDTPPPPPVASEPVKTMPDGGFIMKPHPDRAGLRYNRPP
jgi:hypothetical protein